MTHDLSQLAERKETEEVELQVLDEQDLATLRRLVIEAGNLYGLVTDDVTTPWTDELQMLKEAIKEAKPILGLKW